MTKSDWEDVNKRVFALLPPEERQRFNAEASNTICLCETWEEVNRYNKKDLNSKLIADRRVASAEIISTGRGKHHMSAKESMG